MPPFVQVLQGSQGYAGYILNGRGKSNINELRTKTASVVSRVNRARHDSSKNLQFNKQRIPSGNYSNSRLHAMQYCREDENIP